MAMNFDQMIADLQQQLQALLSQPAFAPTAIDLSGFEKAEKASSAQDFAKMAADIRERLASRGVLQSSAEAGMLGQAQTDVSTALAKILGEANLQAQQTNAANAAQAESLNTGRKTQALTIGQRLAELLKEREAASKPAGFSLTNRPISAPSGGGGFDLSSFLNSLKSGGGGGGGMGTASPGVFEMADRIRREREGPGGLQSSSPSSTDFAKAMAMMGSPGATNFLDQQTRALSALMQGSAAQAGAIAPGVFGGQQQGLQQQFMAWLAKMFGPGAIAAGAPR